MSSSANSPEPVRETPTWDWSGPRYALDVVTAIVFAMCVTYAGLSLRNALVDGSTSKLSAVLIKSIIQIVSGSLGTSPIICMITRPKLSIEHSLRLWPTLAVGYLCASPIGWPLPMWARMMSMAVCFVFMALLVRWVKKRFGTEFFPPFVVRKKHA